MANNRPNSQTLERLQTLLAEVTGNDIEEIGPHSDLYADLGIDPDQDFGRVLHQVNVEFDVQLDEETVMSELEETGETVLELAKLIDEELELG